MPLPQQIKQRFGQQGQVKLDNEDSFIQLRHILMKEYGWMTRDEFKGMLMPELWDLLDCIRHDKEMEEKEYKKVKGRKR